MGLGTREQRAESRALVGEGGAHLQLERWVTRDLPFMSSTFVEPHTSTALLKAIERACSLQLV